MGNPVTPRVRNHIDFATLVALLALMLLSLGIVYSASSTFSMRKYEDSEWLLMSHTVKVAIAIVLLFITMKIDYHRYQNLTKLALVSAVLLLLATFAAGVVAKGAARWIRFGYFGIQPSEFAKYALLFHLCTLFSVKGELVRDFRRGFVPMMVWIGLVTVLVLIQPNFSMGTMIFLLSVAMVYIGGVRLKHLVLTFGSLVPLLGVYLMSAPYRVDRLRNYLDSLLGEFSLKNTPYQLFQGIIAFGRGGIFGVGAGESRQRDGFLPEAHTDFVFSILGEEYGFVGTMFFMILFLLIMHRGYRIARFAPDAFGRNLAIAITSAVTLYAVINAGVTLGLLPTTGLPMPFVSFGGSSMVLSAAAVGVLLNISSQTDLHPRASQVPVVGAVNAGKSAVGKVY
ncbi:MAG TPA: putative peptidoglycan glycosyltransferase FtsW [Bacteroidota bacterium]|nr:putative peptidoglycan glycosyltransferase FtsW [Bacteroidota bacterium]